MFIQTENTPNPNSLKFLPGVSVTGGEPKNYLDKSESVDSKLVNLLFNIQDVKAVFLGSDFITVTKTDHASWDVMKPEILVTIMDYISSGQTIFTEGELPTNIYDENDSEIVKQIKELIEIKVRPAVAQDGGDIIFKGYEDGIVKLELHGSCSGCPSSTVTLKNGIENMLKYYVPEIVAVEAVN